MVGGDEGNKTESEHREKGAMGLRNRVFADSPSAGHGSLDSRTLLTERHSNPGKAIHCLLETVRITISRDYNDLQLAIQALIKALQGLPPTQNEPDAAPSHATAQNTTRSEHRTHPGTLSGNRKVIPA